MLKLTDVHCHILPGVDDGPRKIDTAVRMMRMEYKDGVRRIIVTPHYRQNMFETPMNKITESFKQVRQAAKEVADDLEIQLGCEYHSHLEMVPSLLAGARPTMAGSRYVLTEFSGRHSFRVIWKQVCDLQAAGYQPIIAHMERYPVLRDNIAHVRELSEQGVWLQVNAGSILGEEGFSMKWFCRKLLKEELIDLVGTDAHNTKSRRPNLGECAAYVEKKMGHSYAEHLFVKNPNKIRPE